VNPQPLLGAGANPAFEDRIYAGHARDHVSGGIAGFHHLYWGHDGASEPGANETLEPHRYDRTPKAIAEARDGGSGHRSPAEKLNRDAVVLLLIDEQRDTSALSELTNQLTTAFGSLGNGSRKRCVLEWSR